MLKTTSTNPNLHKSAAPSIVSISDAFRGTPLKRSAETRRRKSGSSHHLFNPNQVQLTMEL